MRERERERESKKSFLLLFSVFLVFIVYSRRPLPHRLSFSHLIDKGNDDDGGGSGAGQ